MVIYSRVGVLFLIFGLLLGNIAAAAPHASSALVITDYQSEFELITQNPVEKISLSFTNRSPKPISSVQLLVPIDRVVIGSVVEDAYGQPQTLVETNTTLAVTVDQKRTVTFREYRIDLNRAVEPEGDFKISTIKLYYNSFFEFKPKNIDLFEDQKVLLTAYKVPASPYRIEKAVSTITYGDVGSQRKEKGEATAVNPLSPVSVRLHFVLNVPFVQTSITKRYIEVSHWGNAYFKDEYKLHNRGAKFRGAFSTIDFHKSRKDTGKNAFRSETIKLPVNAFGLFYRDEIGNISTSTVSERSDGKYVTLKPRFSLLGDWNCTWEIAHNIPTDDVLSKKVGSNTYKYEYPVAHLLHRVSSDVYELRVALPEGAKILSHNVIKGSKPNKVGTDLSYSYLDFIGRPTLVYTFNNYLPRISLDAKLVIEYTLADHYLLIEPAYLVGGLMLLFGIYLAFSKMDLSFGNEQLEEEQEARGAVPASRTTPSTQSGTTTKPTVSKDKKQK